MLRVHKNKLCYSASFFKPSSSSFHPIHIHFITQFEAYMGEEMKNCKSVVLKWT